MSQGSHDSGPHGRNRGRAKCVASVLVVALCSVVAFLALRWEDIVCYRHVVRLRADPSRIFEFSETEAGSIERRAVGRFLASPDGRRKYLGLLIDTVEAVLTAPADGEAFDDGRLFDTTAVAVLQFDTRFAHLISADHDGTRSGRTFYVSPDAQMRLALLLPWADAAMGGSARSRDGLEWRLVDIGTAARLTEELTGYSDGTSPDRRYFVVRSPGPTELGALLDD